MEGLCHSKRHRQRESGSISSQIILIHQMKLLKEEISNFKRNFQDFGKQVPKGSIEISPECKEVKITQIIINIHRTISNNHNINSLNMLSYHLLLNTRYHNTEKDKIQVFIHNKETQTVNIDQINRIISRTTPIIKSIRVITFTFNNF